MATAAMTVRIEMTDEVRAIFDEAKRLRDLMEPVVKASVHLFDCECEFEDDLSACSEDREWWCDTVIAYKKATNDWPEMPASPAARTDGGDRREGEAR